MMPDWEKEPVNFSNEPTSHRDIWSFFSQNSFLNRQISVKTKILLQDMQIESLDIRSLLILLLALHLEHYYQFSLNSKQRHNRNLLFNFQQNIPYIVWFTGLTSIFGFLILFLVSLTFAAYFGFNLAR